jgi:hypothetical protein
MEETLECNRAYYHLQLLQTFTIHLQSDNPFSGNGMTKQQQQPQSSFLFACPQLPVVATTLV